jgi:hypothetical protein
MPDDGADIFALVRRELESLLAPDDTSREAKLLRRWERKRRALRGHARSFFVVNGFIFLLWLTLAASVGVWFPWFVFPLLGWGMGMTMHALGYRSWVNEHAGELRRARERLGLLPPPAGESSWDQLEARCKAAVGEARAALEATPPSVDAGPLLAQLDEGEQRMTELLRGARAVDQTLGGVTPGGVPSVERAIAAVDEEHAAATEPRTRSALEQKRALLLSRRAKVEALREEQSRIEATAEGFLLAAENARLDALRFTRDASERAELDAALKRLHDELDVLEQVHRELSDL